MSLTTLPFVYDFKPGTVHYGRGCIANIGQALADRGLADALVGCGTHVGANDALMTPIKRGLGDRLAGIFDETSPRNPSRRFMTASNTSTRSESTSSSPSAVETASTSRRG